MPATTLTLQDQIDGSKLAEKGKRLARRLVRLMKAHANCAKTTGVDYRAIYDADKQFVMNVAVQTIAYNQCLDECGDQIAKVTRSVETINDQLRAAGWEYHDHQWQPPRSQ